MTQPIDKDLTIQNDLSLTDTAKDSLYSAMRWMRFISITGWVLYGLGALGFLIQLGSASRGSNEDAALIFLLALLIYIIFFFPLYFAYNASLKGIRAIENIDNQDLEDSMGFFRRLMTFYGVMTIIMLVIYAIGILVALALIAK